MGAPWEAWRRTVLMAALALLTTGAAHSSDVFRRCVSRAWVQAVAESHEVAVELEMRPLNVQVAAWLDTPQGDLGSLFPGRADLDWASMPAETAARIQSAFEKKLGARPPDSPARWSGWREIRFRDLDLDARIALVDWANLGRSFDESRRVRGLVIRPPKGAGERVETHFERLLSGGAAENIAPRQASAKELEEGVRVTETTLSDGVELHYRARGWPSQAIREARRFQLENGIEPTHQHAHLTAQVREADYADPTLAALRKIELLVRANHAAEMIDLVEHRARLIRRADGDRAFYGPMPSERLAPGFELVEKGLRARASDWGLRSQLKLGLVGYWGSGKYDRAGVDGLEARFVHQSSDFDLVGSFLDSLQYAHASGDTGISRAELLGWARAWLAKGRPLAELPGRAHWNWPAEELLARAPREIRREVDRLGRAGFLARADSSRHELKYLLHDWSWHPLLWNEPLALARVRAEQLRLLRAMNFVEQSVEAVRGFVLSSGLYERVLGSVLRSVDEAPPVPFPPPRARLAAGNLESNRKAVAVLDRFSRLTGVVAVPEESGPAMEILKIPRGRSRARGHDPWYRGFAPLGRLIADSGVRVFVDPSLPVATAFDPRRLELRVHPGASWSETAGELALALGESSLRKEPGWRGTLGQFRAWAMVRIAGPGSAGALAGERALARDELAEILVFGAEVHDATRRRQVVDRLVQAAWRYRRAGFTLAALLGGRVAWAVWDDPP